MGSQANMLVDANARYVRLGKRKTPSGAGGKEWEIKKTTPALKRRKRMGAVLSMGARYEWTWKQQPS